ncbi:hypothetical protein ABZ446_05235 [Streptomyces sp. NPDC005813]|uniref:hypothetical protein n=1 Tax=Streptomyces sp. NPDC005813 TaxID=3155592 RepID=UPI0033DDFE31
MTEQPTNPEPTQQPATPLDSAPAPAEDAAPAPAQGAAPAPVSDGVQAPAQDPAQEPAPAKKRVRRGRVAAVVGSLVLVGALVGGVGYTVVTVQDADRDAGAPTWKFPKGQKEEAKAAKSSSSLASMLVPYDDGWTRGPDIAGFGSDAALSGGQAAALRKESVRDLPRSQRRRIEKEIDKQHTKGMAMRSYLYGGSTLDDDGTYTVSVELAQIEDKRAVRNMSTFQNEFLEALSVFRHGPKIEGHKNAKCFLPPKDKEEKLDMMVCSAYQGDVLVSATAYAAKPLNTKGVAKLLREQLDRIEEPGEAV